MLSTKLINAINHQTNLDDSLQATRHELDWAKQEVKRVQAEKRSLDDAIAQGVLVKKAEMDRTIAELRAELAIQKMHRENAEKSKTATEGELENLTSSLFEEANKMVEQAKKETKAVEKRNSQLKSQLNDQEAMLKSQHNQLQDMRLTLERTETNARESSSTPGTPITSTATTGTSFDIPHTPNDISPSSNIPPDHPLHFSELITPVLRTDVSSYTDFAELLAWARRGAPHSRTASGNVASASATNLSTSSIAPAANTSSPNLPGAFAFSSANSSPNSANFNSAYAFTPPLKESKFYKRALIEDIEPTLRLDLAPGLSFLSRRTVNSALLNGTLSIEPFTPPAKFYSSIFACSLCGEARRAEPYIRRHRFRTSESEDASRYPLCEFCLGRVRSAADFVGFLRMVRDGHWRAEGKLEERKAWEESVRLRERMFWARVGGGVVPAAAAVGRGRGVEWEAEKVEAGKVTDLDLRRAEEERREDSGAATPELKAPAPVEPAKPLRNSEGDTSDDNAEDMSRATINVPSQGAASGMPELKPVESADFHTPETEMPPPITPEQDAADSDREQADASAQLRSEAELRETERKVTSETNEASKAPDPRRTSTHHVTEQSFAAAADHFRTGSNPENSTETRMPGRLQRTDSSEPERPSTASSQRGLSPSKTASATGEAGAGKEERRPSNASSVLARVRAMEARGGK